MHSIKVFALALLALLIPVLSAAQPTALPTQSLGWDFSDEQITSELIDRFEVNYDDGGYVSAGLLSNGPGNYRDLLPPLISGSHTVTIRACNPNGCSLDSLPFTFNMVAGVPTSTVDVGSIRIIATPDP